VKLPFDFGIRFLLRLVAPGALLAAICLPLTRVLADLAYPALDDDVLFITSGLIFGFSLLLLDMPIYMVFEGRRFWPDWLRSIGVARQSRRVDQLKKRADAASGIMQVELDILAHQYPIDRTTGSPYAPYPTRLGNLLARFETYPTVKYGLDGVFFWPRLWVSIDKDLREELDSAQAVVDGAIYCAFVFCIAALISVGYWAWLPSSAWWHWPASAVAFVVLARLFYTLALPRYAQYGDLFEAVFDQYRKKLEFADLLADLDAETAAMPRMRTERERNRAVWRFLRWHRYRMPTETENSKIENW
jgi:hypothetical protein